MPIFQIYSIGDGVFMRRVIEGVAMLYSAGTLQSLGTVGLLFALLLTGYKAIATGRVELPQLMAGLILFLVMFGTSVTVQINDVGMPPGKTQQDTYLVSGVPLGVAFMGSVISTVGLEISDRLEQAFGAVNSSNSIRDVGFGRSLDWLAAVRFANHVGTTGVPRLERFKANTVQFMMNCASRGFIMNPGRAATAPTAANPLDPNAFGFNAPGAYTGWTTDTGTTGDISCETAHQNLMDYSQGDLFADWAKGVAGQNQFSGAGTPVGQAEDAFGAVGLNLVEAQAYVNGIVMKSAWQTAIPNIPYLGGEQVRQFAMMASAAEQSAIQHAGEETMFRRLMRPMMAFFETIVYAAAPFMALVVGLGAAGLRMVGKYALVTLWVAMWIPTIAIINQFQLTMAERAIHVVTHPPSGGVGIPLGSMSGASAVENVAIDWINTGSILAASTPAITLMLLFGSAMTAVGLAQSLKGGDHINEKITSPDAAKDAPVIQAQPMMTQSYSSGTMMGGAPEASFNMQSVNQSAIASTQGASQQSTAQWSAKHGATAGQSVALDSIASLSGSGTQTAGATQAEENAVSLLKKSGVDFGSSDSATIRAAMAVSEMMSGGLKVSPGSLLTSFMAGDKGKGGGKGGGGLGAEAGYNLLSKNDTTRAVDRAVQLGEQIHAATSNNESLRTAVSGGVASAFEANSRISGTESNRAGRDTTLAKATSDTVAANSAYLETATNLQGTGSSQRIGYGAASQALVRSGSVGDAVQTAMEYGSVEAFSHAMNLVEAGGMYGSRATNGEQHKAVAALMVLTDNNPGFQQSPEGAGARAAAANGLLQQTGILQTGAGFTSSGSAATANAGIQGPAFGGTKATVESAPIGSSTAPETAFNTLQGVVAQLKTQEGRTANQNRLVTEAGGNAGAINKRAGDAGQAEGQGGNANFDQHHGRSEQDFVPKGETNKEAVKNHGGVSVAQAWKANTEGNVTTQMVGHSGFTGSGNALSKVMDVPDSSPGAPSSGSSPGFTNAVADAMSGKSTGGHKLPADAAMAWAAMQQTNSGQPLGSEDIKSTQAAVRGMAPHRREALEQVDHNWKAGEPMPTFANPAAMQMLAASNEQSSVLRAASGSQDDLAHDRNEGNWNTFRDEKRQQGIKPVSLGGSQNSNARSTTVRFLPDDE